MLTTILLGIAASLVTEFVRWIDKKLVGSPLEGRGAFLLAFWISFIIATFKVTIFDWNLEIAQLLRSAWVTFGSIFALSQVWFQLIAKTFNLRVSPTFDQPLR